MVIERTTIYNTPLRRNHSKGEDGFSPSKVDVAGYKNPQEQIKALIDAGMRLDSFRRLNYEFNESEKVPDDYIDPTRSKNYDVVDAELDLKRSIENIKNKEKLMKKIKEEKPNSSENNLKEVKE